MAKQDKNKNLNILAMKIAKLEKEIQLGKNIEENENKIHIIMSSLSMEDIFYIVNRIENKKLMKIF